jgi:phage terminase large subunit
VINPEFDFKHPDYDAILGKRVERLRWLRDDPAQIEHLNAHYKENPVDFINDWGMTFDPRNAELDKPTLIPFVLFQKQSDFIDWIIGLWKGRKDGLCDKSRDMGVSWLTIGIAVWMWKYYDGAVIGFGSRKEEYVDKLDDPKSLLWKARKFIEQLPVEFRPLGYDESKHAPYMRIINPENGSVIIGEAGENIGRGNRTSIYFKDESAFYDKAEAIELALSQTSNCKIDLSSANGAGNVFYRKRHSGKVPVFTFHWKDDPRKDKAWYEEQKAKYDAVIVAQEIDIDYNASSSDAWITGDSVQKAQMTRPGDVRAIGKWIVSIDAAHMGNDESVIHRRKGRLNLEQLIKRKVDGVQLAGAVTEECRMLEEQPGEEIFAIIIELDGAGVSCYDQLKLGNYAERVFGVHTGAQLADNRNYNVRAKAWRDARDYLNDEPCVLPDDPELKSQLCSMKYEYRDGLLLMQDKKKYKKDFGRSPDRADAFVLSFCKTIPPKKNKPKDLEPRGGGEAWMAA